MGLTIRMLIALTLAAVLTLATAAGLVWVALQDGGWAFVLLASAFVAGGLETEAVGRRRRRARDVRPEDARRAETIVTRLALIGSVRAPAVVIERNVEPLSWTLSVPWRPAAINLTTGLLDRLDDPELEAVVAHELVHVLNRDATVMTLIAAVPVAFLRGLPEMVREDKFRGTLAVLFYGLWLAPVMALLVLVARLVSRQRELVADAGAARLTGSPAAVAAALVELSDELVGGRRGDLRDVFHFLPARDPRGVRRLWASHPRLADRLESLHRMETAQQG